MREVIVICLLAVAVASSPAAVIHVPADQPTIQLGVNAAVDGDTVLVAPGVYTESVVVNEREITLRSEGGQESTVLDAGGSSNGLLFSGVVGTDMVVDGFTIMAAVSNGVYCLAGTGPRLANIVFADNGGAGLRSTDADAVLEDCEFSGNSGGLWVSGGSVTLSGCTFFDSDNLVEDDSGLWMTGCSFFGDGLSRGRGARGDGLRVTHSLLFATDCHFSGHSSGAVSLSYPKDVSFTGCTFTDNYSDAGGALYSNGADSGGSKIDLVECVFERNSSAENGGAAAVRYADRAVFTDCIFRENSAPGLGGGVNTHDATVVEFQGCEFYDNYAGNDGGGVRVYAVTASDATFNHCLFVGNECADRGAALRVSQCTGLITHCTVYNNHAASHGGSVHIRSANPPDVIACIIASGTGYGISTNPDSGIPDVTYCDVHDMSTGLYEPPFPDYTGTAGNISADPLFCGAATGDFTLHELSPCATGGPGGGVSGAFGIGCGGTVVETQSWGSIKAMYR